MQPLEMPGEGCGPWGCQERDAAPGDAKIGMQALGISGEGCGPWKCWERDVVLRVTRRRMQPLEMSEGCEEKDVLPGDAGRWMQPQGMPGEECSSLAMRCLATKG